MKCGQGEVRSRSVLEFQCCFGGSESVLEVQGRSDIQVQDSGVGRFRGWEVQVEVQVRKFIIQFLKVLI